MAARVAGGRDGSGEKGGGHLALSFSGSRPRRMSSSSLRLAFSSYHLRLDIWLPSPSFTPSCTGGVPRSASVLPVSPEPPTAVP